MPFLKVKMSTQNKAGIYKIVNSANGKFYVGHAADLRRRWSKHLRDLSKGVHHSQKLQRAWNKYGKEAFKFVIFEAVEAPRLVKPEQYELHTPASIKKELTRLLNELLVKREQFWLDELDAVKRGYNIAKNATASALGLKRSASMRKKMVEIRREAPITEEHQKKMTEGRLKSPDFKEHVQHMQQSNVGRNHSAKAKNNIGIASQLRWQDPAYKANFVEKVTGKKHTPEARKKISAGKLGVPLSDIHRANLSVSHKGYRPTAATRAKLSAAQKARRTRELDESKQLSKAVGNRKEKS